jgi:3-dehydroquinate synthase
MTLENLAVTKMCMQCVLVDTNTLSTLPDRELRSGIAEVIKYGLIKDADFFSWLEVNMQGLIDRDPAALAYAIRRSCENKAAVVTADEREEGVRATLNLGHTFGHAIETGLGYGAWLHGEAVAAGTLMAADMSLRQGWIGEDVFRRLDSLMRRAQLPVNLANPAAETEGGAGYSALKLALGTDAFLDIMSVDKKVADGQLSLVLLKGDLGGCVITNKFDAVLLRAVVDDYTSSRK